MENVEVTKEEVVSLHKKLHELAVVTETRKKE